jgi:DNA-binding Xre family transcriptional regulator
VPISYNKLWKLLIDKKMKKMELQRLAGVSASIITKLGREESVTTTVLMKICNALKCDIGDIMEVIPDDGILWKEERHEKDDIETIRNIPPAPVDKRVDLPKEKSANSQYTIIDNDTVTKVAQTIIERNHKAFRELAK